MNTTIQNITHYNHTPNNNKNNNNNNNKNNMITNNTNLPVLWHSWRGSNPASRRAVRLQHTWTIKVVSGKRAFKIPHFSIKSIIFWIMRTSSPIFVGLAPHEYIVARIQLHEFLFYPTFINVKKSLINSILTVVTIIIYYYRTRVRSLAMLVSNWLTHWLTAV